MAPAPDLIAEETEARLESGPCVLNKGRRGHWPGQLPRRLDDAGHQEAEDGNAKIIVHVNLGELGVNYDLDVLALGAANDTGNKARRKLGQLVPAGLVRHVVADMDAQRLRRDQGLLALRYAHTQQQALALNARIVQDNWEENFPRLLDRVRDLRPVLQTLHGETETGGVSFQRCRNRHAQRVRANGDWQPELLAHAPQEDQEELEHALEQPAIEELLLLHNIDPPSTCVHVHACVPQGRPCFPFRLLAIEAPVQLLRNQAPQHLLHACNVEGAQKPLPDSLHTFALRGVSARHDSCDLLLHQPRQARPLRIPQPSVGVRQLPLRPRTPVTKSLQTFQEMRGHFRVLARPRIRRAEPVLAQGRGGLRTQPQLKATARSKGRLVLLLLEDLPIGQIFLEDQVPHMLHTRHRYEANTRHPRRAVAQPDASSRQRHALRLPVRESPS